MTAFPPPPAASATFTDSLSVLTVSQPITLSQWLFLNRLDYIYGGGRHRVMARLANSQLNRPDFIWSPYKDFVSGLKQPVGSAMVGSEDALGAHGINDFRIGWTVFNIHWDRAHPEIPTLTAPDVILPGSPAEFGYRNRNRNLEIHDTVELIAGKHIFSMGGGILDRRIDVDLTLARDGMFSFDSVLSFAADFPQDFTGVLPRLQPQSVSPNFSESFRNFQWFGFSSDTYHVSSRFTANLGIRYDYLGAPEALSGDGALLKFGPDGSLPQGIREAQFVPLTSGAYLYPANKADWSARGGSSFDLFGTGRTVLRDGYGIFYDRAFDNIWETALINNLVVTSGIPFSNAPPELCSAPAAPQGYLSRSCQNALLSNYNGLTDNPPYPTAFDPGMKDGYAQNFFVTLEQKISRDWVAEISGLGSLGRHLITTDLLNRSYTLPFQGTVNQQNGDTSRYGPFLPEIYYRASEGSSHYSAATVLVKHRTSRTYFQVAYTLSHSMDNQSDPLNGELLSLTYIGNANPTLGQLATFVTQYDSSGDRGNSDFDQRHNLVELVTWELPGLRWHGFRYATQGWQFSEIGAFRSGFPFSVLIPAATMTDLFDNRADLSPGVSVRLNPPQPYDGGKYILNPAAFMIPTAGVGDTTRNEFYGPSLYNLDASLSKRFSAPRISERAALSVRIDVYNVLNHLNLGQPVNVLGPDFGLATYGRTLQNSGFPVIAPLQETSRRLQFLLRIEF
jgi:hypothetical protein